MAKRLLQHVLLEGRSLVSLAQQRRQSFPSARYRFRTALRSLAAQPPAISMPVGALILVGDALWFRFANRRWTLYLLALRPVRGCLATLLDPILLPGKENSSDWGRAIGAIPSRLRRRVRALVSDGFAGVKGIARSHGWVLQRCHFHLIRSLHVVRGTRRPLRGTAVREAAYQLIRKALRQQDCEQLRCLTEQLQALAASADCPRRLRLIVRGFLRERPSFHGYLIHPELHLPTTTNALESMGSIIRSTVGTVRTPRALQRWATALVRVRPQITCNGADFPPN